MVDESGLRSAGRVFPLRKRLPSTGFRHTIAAMGQPDSVKNSFAAGVSWGGVFALAFRRVCARRELRRTCDKAGASAAAVW
jgi:hypothetical protein